MCTQQQKKMTTKQINDKLYAMIECLAENYGFDADEAMEHATSGTDTDHVSGIVKLLSKEKAPAKEKVAKVTEETDEVKKIRHNIQLWTKKLDAGEYKDHDAHVAKIQKEEKKLAKLLGDVVVPPPKAAAAAPKVETEKRIKRFSPAMATQFGAALTKVGVSLSDKLKKEFSAYIEELDADSFRAESLADHMRIFADTKKPAVDDVKPEDDTEDDEPPHLEHDEPAEKPTVTLTIAEMASVKILAATADPEVLWDAKNKRHVKGPAMDEDEDMTEVTFKGKTYAVGDKTGRVYEAKDEGDVFTGFKGVGLFKTMT